MSHKKEKLVLKANPLVEVDVPISFTIVKSVNTLEFGVPGDDLSRAEVDRVLINNARNIREGFLSVEFIG